MEPKETGWHNLLFFFAWDGLCASCNCWRYSSFRQRVLLPSSGKENTYAGEPVIYSRCFPCMKKEAQSAAETHCFENYTTNGIQQRKILNYITSPKPVTVGETGGLRNWRSVAGRWSGCTTDGPADRTREGIHKNGVCQTKGGPIHVSRVG